MKKLIFVILTLTILCGCAKTRVVVKEEAPPDPNMLPVKVVDGVVKGKNLENMIENYMRLWRHIYVLKTKGFTASQTLKELIKKGIDKKLARQMVIKIFNDK